MRLLLLVCLGGAVGSGTRFLLSGYATRLLGAAFPWGTLAVNLIGCFVMGALIEWITLRFEGSPELRALLATGFLGGFTTFSAFSYDFLGLMQRGESVAALAYGVVTVVGSLVAVWAGLMVARLAL